jgi:hypothetical protein
MPLAHGPADDPVPARRAPGNRAQRPRGVGGVGGVDGYWRMPSIVSIISTSREAGPRL